MSDNLIWSETQLPYLLATPEKVLLDALYISTRKSRRFVRMPELELTSELFSKSAFKKIFRQLPLSTRILNAMQLRADELGIL